MQQAQEPQPAGRSRLAEALRVLGQDGVVGYPSETVWGLAAWPASEVAVERLYRLKGREASKPVQLSCLDLQEARRWLPSGRPEEEAIQALAHAFWPGPLTLLTLAVPGCPEWLAPGGVVGLRVPAHPLIQALLAASGGTLATTSLNPSGQPAASTAQQARAYGLADLLLTAGEDGEDQAPASPAGFSGLASTVFDLRTQQVVRQGALSGEAIRQVLGGLLPVGASGGRP